MACKLPFREMDTLSGDAILSKLFWLPIGSPWNDYTFKMAMTKTMYYKITGHLFHNLFKSLAKSDFHLPVYSIEMQESTM